MLVERRAVFCAVQGEELAECRFTLLQTYGLKRTAFQTEMYVLRRIGKSAVSGRSKPVSAFFQSGHLFPQFPVFPQQGGVFLVKAAIFRR